MFKPAICILFILTFVPGVIAAATTSPISMERIAEIATFLPAQPAGPGKPIADREYWNALAKNDTYKSQIAAAEKILGQPLPDLPEDLYLEFSRNGNRANYEKTAFARRNRLMPLVVAECLQNEGRFIEAIETLANTLCDEKSWVMPAHDQDLGNYNGTTITIDLFSSALSSELAITNYLLQDKLNPTVKSRISAEVNKRILSPFTEMVSGRREKDWWITHTNNWNSVCLSGVVGCALAEVDSAQVRAGFIAAAEHFSQYFLSGFTPDGYCSEGVDYWNYGFGEFALLSEKIRMATSNKIDLLADSKAKKPAAYGAKIEIINGFSPAFSDCSVYARPSGPLMWLLNRKYGWGLKDYETLDTRTTFRSLSDLLIYHDAQQETEAGAAAVVDGPSDDSGLRTLFTDAAVYIGRPDPVTSDSMGVALKGGDNAEHHNHNDLGSYVVVIGNTPILLDPGKEVYTKRTFSSKRYDSKMLNSYGHPVPIVAGELQSKGKQSQGTILSTDFTDTTDTVVIDITSAYKVPTLKKLVRTFQYVRGAKPTFLVTDEVEFSSPETFETALISAGTFDVSNDKSVIVRQDKVGADVIITSSTPYNLSVDTIKENAPVQPNRLAIKLLEPVTSATVTAVVGVKL